MKHIILIILFVFSSTDANPLEKERIAFKKLLVSTVKFVFVSHTKELPRTSGQYLLDISPFSDS